MIFLGLDFSRRMATITEVGRKIQIRKLSAHGVDWENIFCCVEARISGQKMKKYPNKINQEENSLKKPVSFGAVLASYMVKGRRFDYSFIFSPIHRRRVTL